MTIEPTDERVEIPCGYARSHRIFSKSVPPGGTIPSGTEVWMAVIDGTPYEYPFDAASYDGETLYLRRDLAERDGHVK